VGFRLHLGRSLYLIVLGPAGSGKTTLTAAFGSWLSEVQEARVAYVNLDPGADYLPYKPDVDARDYVTVEALMREKGLGPNGALVESMQALCERKTEILEKVSRLEADIVLVDTPGQMELFLFHDAGPAFSRELAKRGAAVALVLFDSGLAKSPSHFATLRLMSLVVQLRLDVPTVAALNKGDLETAHRAAAWAKDPSLLLFDLEGEQGVIAELAAKLVELMNTYSVAARIPLVSAKERWGFQELYDLLHEVWCACGDLT
jgi:GTPase SAR1 family protein